MKKAFLFYDVKLSGDISLMCGSDCIKPFPDGRMTEHNNRRMVQAHIDILVKKKGVVGMRIVSWDGLRMDSIHYLTDIEWLIPYDKIRQRIHRISDDIKIEYTKKCLEYKPWRFARIHNISVGQICYGYYYEGVSQYDETWYELKVDRASPGLLERILDEELKIATEYKIKDGLLIMNNIDDVAKVINYAIETNGSLSDEKI